MTAGKNNSLFISVVVCTFKRPFFLKKCIDSILLNRYENYEIIVVGQGTDKAPQKIIDENFGGNASIHYVHTDIVGLSHARNIGCNSAQGEVIAFIDDDAMATVDWLEGYAEAFQTIVPVPAMVGGMIEPDWETPTPRWYPAERQFLLGIYNIGNAMQPFPTKDLPIGANFAVQKSVVEEMGGFDTQVGFAASRKNPMIAGEDSLLGLKVKAADYPIYYQPKAKVFHHINSAKLSRKYFFKRHFWEGVTHIVLENRSGSATRQRMRGNFFWHIMSIIKNGGKFIAMLMPIKGNSSSRRMLKLSEIAYSLGVCKEAFQLMLRGKNTI
jgi:GT2 family glycosyltransferase